MSIAAKPFAKNEYLPYFKTSTGSASAGIDPAEMF
jgi:hypothetical protein